MRRGCIRWGWACPGVVLSLLLGCSSDTEPGAGAPPLDDTGDTHLDSDATEDPCADPTSTDCACAHEGERIECGEVHELRGDGQPLVHVRKNGLKY